MIDFESGRHRKSCRRYNIRGHIHALTFSCYRQQPFLESNRACRYLAEAVNAARQKHEFLIWSYVFMPEHVHLIVKPLAREYDISLILKSIKQPVAQRFLNRREAFPPRMLRAVTTCQKDGRFRFWQAGGGYDQTLRSGEQVQAAIQYVHHNPVRRGLVTVPQRWFWSSAADWEGRSGGPVLVDTASLIL